MSFTLPPDLAPVLSETPLLANSFLVGGCVRDWLLQRPIKDYDVEVFGVAFDQLAGALAPWGKTDLVGKSFGVVKLTTSLGACHDFTIPRRDSKVAPGHKGFEVCFDPSISPKEAASRRDFTINSLMLNPRTGQLLDFFGGVSDLKQRVLRHTSPAFAEDPLRVLRGMQFSSRFNLTPAPETLALCRAMKTGFKELAPERIREEWFKWASKSVTPSLGLLFLAATEWIDHFPELACLRETPQDPEWHPEGNVFIHTCHSCDAMAQLPGWQQAGEQTRIVLSCAILAHDFGKPLTTQIALKGGLSRIVSPGHEEAGGPISENFLTRIDAPRSIRDRIIPLVVNHLAHLNPLTDRAVRRLAKRLEPESIENLCLVMMADHLGRPPKPPVVPEAVIALQSKAAELQVQNHAPAPILMGRHLIELGLTPGKSFKAVLEKAYEAQLEGQFSSLPDAIAWASREIHAHSPPLRENAD